MQQFILNQQQEAWEQLHEERKIRKHQNAMQLFHASMMPEDRILYSSATLIGFLNDINIIINGNYLVYNKITFELLLRGAIVNLPMHNINNLYSTDVIIARWGIIILPYLQLKFQELEDPQTDWQNLYLNTLNLFNQEVLYPCRLYYRNETLIYQQIPLCNRNFVYLRDLFKIERNTDDLVRSISDNVYRAAQNTYMVRTFEVPYDGESEAKEGELSLPPQTPPNFMLGGRNIKCKKRKNKLRHKQTKFKLKNKQIHKRTRTRRRRRTRITHM